MSSTTSYLSLTKPELDDRINPNIFAENFDLIDNALSNTVSKTELSALKTTADGLASRITTLENNVTNLTTEVNTINTELGDIESLLDTINGEVI